MNATAAEKLPDEELIAQMLCVSLPQPFPLNHRLDEM